MTVLRGTAACFDGRATGQVSVGGADRGAFAALELAILLPFVIVMLLLVVGFGRVERGRQLVDQAAQAASRAASLSADPGTARIAAEQAAQQTLRGGGLSCSSVRVEIDTSAFYPGGYVGAQLTCTADLSRLALAGLPGIAHLTAASTSPLETYRQFNGSAGVDAAGVHR